MTSFEQQVAEALTDDRHFMALEDAFWTAYQQAATDIPVSRIRKAVYAALRASAPRVAAAIEAAFADYEGLDARKNALAAIRGEVS